MVKLLLVDDEPVTRKGLLEFIPWSSLGVAAVESAADGMEALKIAAQFQPDIVISDIKMPNMTGIEFIKRLKQILPGSRIVFLSAYADKENLKNAIDLQIVKFLEKPIKRNEVASVVQKLAAQIDSERAAAAAQRKKTMDSLRLARQKLAVELMSKAVSGHVQEHIALADVDVLYFPWVTSMVARFGSEGAQILHQCEDKLYDSLESRLSVFGLCISGFAGMRDLAVHLFTQKKPQLDKGYEMLQAIKSAAVEVSGAHQDVYLGIGSAVEDLAAVPLSYSQAYDAVGHLFYQGYDGVSIYDSASKKTSWLPETAAGFTDRLKAHDLDGALSHLSALAGSARAARADPGRVRQEYASCVKGLEQISHDFGLPPEWTEQVRQAVCESYTLNELQSALVSALSMDFKDIDANKNLGYVVSRVKSLIDSQYSSSELSIKTLCRQVFMSETYLCDVYKKRTGETINSYITAVRMEKAKELLKNKMVKIGSVAGMVGYSSSDYFTKLFRKHTGLTPSDFRDSCFAPGSADKRGQTQPDSNPPKK